MINPMSYLSLALLCVIGTTACRSDMHIITLINAIECGDDATAKAILEDKTLDVNAPGDNGMTALLQSLISNNKELYARLLERGADPNRCDTAGRCVMNQAAELSESWWLREALIHRGDVNALNKGNRHYPNSTPIFYAIAKRRTENVVLLIKAGANVNHRNDKGVTPLRASAGTGRYELVLKLLEVGADPLKPDHHGGTLVDWFDGRDEEMVPDEDQKPYFRKAGQLLVDLGLMDAESKGQFKKKLRH
jgi:ankyrin repeat protein